MEMLIQLGILAIGFVMLVKGSDWFVDGASSIATKFGIPQLVIGLTIVAMGTSAPEAAVSITAAIHGNADITIGNIVGSNILNILMIVGLSGFIVPVPFVADFRFDTIVAVYAAVLLLVLALPKRKLFRLSGLLMLISYAVYFYLIW